ncbi:LysR family transcriptional regulator [Microbacteriaceae bacterium K1510]|nr:LysR family transcriptional regulator [Microbacteriaceae bacterium K1510]
MKHLRIFHYVDEVARCGSIRKAAEQLHVTSSAVNRRILDLEEELGAPIFERRARGVRLTAAGEVFINFVRGHEGDVERMKSQIEDLKGLRRGTVRFACSQALAHDFLPREVAAFRKQYASVSFDVKVLDHEKAVEALAAYDVDLLLVFRPPYLANLQPLMTLEQRLVAIMPARHPLAEKKTLRLRDCLRYPVALPERGFGGRQLLDEFCARSGLRFQIAAESNSFEFLRSLIGHGDLITFQIEIGAPADNNKFGMVTRDIDDRDLPKANLVLGQLRGRNLPVPTAVFADQLARSLNAARAKADG